MEILHHNATSTTETMPVETVQEQSKIGKFFDSLFGVAGKASQTYDYYKNAPASSIDTDVSLGQQGSQTILGIPKPLAIGIGVVGAIILTVVIYKLVKK